jgi:hypothetical protein
MRCIGAAHPPCVRCLKSSRECIVKFPNRQQRHLSSSRSNVPDHPIVPTSPNALVEHTPSSGVSHVPASPVVQTESTSRLQERSPGLASEHHNALRDQTSLPSIFFSAPITIASVEACESDGHSFGVPASHTRLDSDKASYSTILDLVEL